MAQQEILREYLLALGFQIDQPGDRKVQRVLGVIDKGAKGAAGSLLGLGASAVAMVTVFSNQMQKMYYASQRSGETVGNLQAISYGMKQIGLDGNQMISAIEGMQRAIRLNPGLVGLLHDLGVDASKGPADQLKDLVKVLSRMDPYVGARYAQLFGIDADTLLQVGKNITRLEDAERQRKEFAEALGLDMEKAAESGRKFAADMNTIWEKVGMVKDAASIALLPVFEQISGVTHQVLEDWIRILTQTKDWVDLKDRLLEGFGLKKRGGGVKLAGQAEADDRPWWKRAIQDAGEKQSFLDFVKKGPRLRSNLVFDSEKKTQTPTGTPSTTQEARSALSESFGLRKPIEQIVMWLESRGRRFQPNGQLLRSNKGALGEMQVMPATARSPGYGIAPASDINNPEELARVGQEYIKVLMGKYFGDLGKALAAYNAGPGAVDKAIMFGRENWLSLLPKETQNYVMNGREFADSDKQVSLQANTHIHIHGVTDPKAAADAISARQRDANGDLVRNFRGALR